MAVPGPIATGASTIATGHLCAVTTTLDPLTLSKTVLAGAGGNLIAIGAGVAKMTETLTVMHPVGVPPLCTGLHAMPILTGIPTVLVNKKPVAVVGSQVDAGTVTSGVATVLIGTKGV